MASPFPGMDPFLEGSDFPDVHQKLAVVISELLTPLIVPQYIARVESYVFEDVESDAEVGIMYPDVAVIRSKVEEPLAAYGKASIYTPPTVNLQTIKSFEVNLPVVQILDANSNELITSIEILSPVNKKGEGLKQYRKKRLKLYRAGVHLLEIDLIRRGTRPFDHPQLPKSHYGIALTSAFSMTQIWALDVKDELPTVPIPLNEKEENVPLNIGEAFNLVYERSAYQHFINYKGTPPPPIFKQEEIAWMQTLTKQNK